MNRQLQRLAADVDEPSPHDDAPHQATSGRTRHGIIRFLVTATILGLALYFLWPQLPSMQNSLHVLGSMPLSLIALAVALQIVSYLGSGYLIQGSVEIGGSRVSLLRGIMVTLAANSVGLLAGGTVIGAAMTYKWLRAADVDREGAAFACVLPWACNNALLSVLAIVGLIHLLAVHELSLFQGLAFSAILAILIATVGGVAWSTGHRTAATAWAQRIGSRYAALRHRPDDPARVALSINRFFAGWDLLRQGGWHKPLLGAVVNNGADALMLFVLFFAANHPLSFGALLTGYGLALLFGKIGFVPGGIGVVEATMAVIYGSFNVPHAALVVVILIYRLLSFWIPTVLGFVIVPFLQYQSRTTPTEA